MNPGQHLGHGGQQQYSTLHTGSGAPPVPLVHGTLANTVPVTLGQPAVLRFPINNTTPVATAANYARPPPQGDWRTPGSQPRPPSLPLRGHLGLHGLEAAASSPTYVPRHSGDGLLHTPVTTVSSRLQQNTPPVQLGTGWTAFSGLGGPAIRPPARFLQPYVSGASDAVVSVPGCDPNGTEVITRVGGPTPTPLACPNTGHLAAPTGLRLRGYGPSIHRSSTGPSSLQSAFRPLNDWMAIQRAPLPVVNSPSHGPVLADSLAAPHRPSASLPPQSASFHSRQPAGISYPGGDPTAHGQASHPRSNPCGDNRQVYQPPGTPVTNTHADHARPVQSSATGCQLSTTGELNGAFVRAPSLPARAGSFQEFTPATGRGPHAAALRPDHRPAGPLSDHPRPWRQHSPQSGQECATPHRSKTLPSRGCRVQVPAASSQGSAQATPPPAYPQGYLRRASDLGPALSSAPPLGATVSSSSGSPASIQANSDQATGQGHVNTPSVPGTRKVPLMKCSESPRGEQIDSIMQELQRVNLDERLTRSPSPPQFPPMMDILMTRPAEKVCSLAYDAFSSICHSTVALELIPTDRVGKFYAVIKGMQLDQHTPIVSIKDPNQKKHATKAMRRASFFLEESLETSTVPLILHPTEVPGHFKATLPGQDITERTPTVTMREHVKSTNPLRTLTPYRPPFWQEEDEPPLPDEVAEQVQMEKVMKHKRSAKMPLVPAKVQQTPPKWPKVKKKPPLPHKPLRKPASIYIPPRLRDRIKVNQEMTSSTSSGRSASTVTDTTATTPCSTVTSASIETVSPAPSASKVTTSRPSTPSSTSEKGKNAKTNVTSENVEEQK